MTTNRAVLAGLALVSVFLGGCASAPAAGRSKARRDCITTREINVMKPLDDRHVFVKVGADRHYLFTMEGQCPGLSLARQLAIWEAGSRVCEDAGNLLAFEHATVGAMRCRIGRIESVPDEDAALERINAEVPPR